MLSERQIHSALAREKSYKLFDGGGLFLEFAPFGGAAARIRAGTS
jgi:hypothetical protein